MFMPACLGTKTPPGSQNFTPGTTSFVIPSGYETLTVTMSGGGGGGVSLTAANVAYAGSAGGNTYITATGVDMHANGGAGGDIYYADPGYRAPGGTASGGTTNTTGGGSPGGNGGDGYYFGGDMMMYGEDGGHGGYSTKAFASGEIPEGITVSVVVGGGGAPGNTGANYPGTAGTAGYVTISWT